MQYQILHNFLPTNKLLYKMQIVESSRCNFCNLYDQDLYHLLIYCFTVRNFWFEFQEWFNTTNNRIYVLSNNDIFFGYPLEEK